MKASDGYTLAECLVALFIIGLTLVGVSAAARLISRDQSHAVALAHSGERLRSVQEELDRFMAGQGPFTGPDADVFEGQPSGFRFRCAPTEDCRVWLSPSPNGMTLRLAGPHLHRTILLEGVRSAQFSYGGARTIGPIWPADAATVQPLKSIGLMAKTDAGPVPIADVQVWIDQGPACEFDVILKDCRR